MIFFTHNKMSKSINEGDIIRARSIVDTGIAIIREAASQRSASIIGTVTKQNVILTMISSVFAIITEYVRDGEVEIDVYIDNYGYKTNVIMSFIPFIWKEECRYISDPSSQFKFSIDFGKFHDDPNFYVKTRSEDGISIPTSDTTTIHMSLLHAAMVTLGHHYIPVESTVNMRINSVNVGIKKSVYLIDTAKTVTSRSVRDWSENSVKNLYLIIYPMKSFMDIERVAMEDKKKTAVKKVKDELKEMAAKLAEKEEELFRAELRIAELEKFFNTDLFK